LLAAGRRGPRRIYILTVDMRAMVISALLIALAGCGGDTPTERVQAPTRSDVPTQRVGATTRSDVPTQRVAALTSRREAREIVYLYRVQGDDPMPDSISLRADGTADIRRGGGGAGIRWIKAELDRHETARATRLVKRAPWKALDGTTVVPGGFGGWDNDMRYMLRRGPWSITVTDAHVPRAIRPLIRELDAIIEDDKGRRLRSLLTARRVSAPTVDP
jgi:hypothetical protein